MQGMSKQKKARLGSRLTAWLLAAGMVFSLLPASGFLPAAAAASGGMYEELPAGSAQPLAEAGRVILHYDFAEGAADVSGSGYDGAVTGQGVTIAGGIAYFTGDSASDIEVPVAAFRQENLTVSMMVRTDAQPDTWTTLLEASAPGTEGSAVMKFIARTGTPYNDALSMTVGATGEESQVRITDSGTQLPVGQWCALTYVQEGAAGRVYLNGRRIAERAELAFSPAQLPESGVVSLGGARYGDDPSFDGQMSDFRVYGEALSDAQVEALYTENLAEVTFDLGEVPEDEGARAVYDQVSALPDNITYKEGPAVREARAAYDALTAGQQDMLAADVLRKLTYAENALEAVYAAFTFRVTVGGMGGDTPYTFDRSPWLNAQRLRDEEKQQLADSLTEEVFYQYYNGYRVGQITGTRDVDNYSGMAGVQQEARPNDNLCSPWSTDRYWAYVTSPYLGMAFTTKGVFATQVYDYRGPISNAFAYDGRIYQVFDNRVESYSSDAVLQVGVNYSDPALQEEMGLDWQSVDNYPGKGASDQGPEDRYTFRYAYAKYNADHKWEGLVAGIPDGYMETLDLNAEGEDLAAAKIRYQHFIGPQGDAYIVTTQSVIDATPENSGSPIGAYVIIGEMARALLAQGEGVREALAVTGTPVGDAQTAADGAVTQKFINGTLYAKDGTYKFFTDEQTAAVNRLMADIRQAAGVPDGTTLESFQAAIAAAESAYAAMDEVLQASVTNYDTIDRLKNAVADIEAVEAMIAALPEPDTLTDKASVLAVMEPLEAAEAAVNGLDEVYRKLVPSLDKLAAVREMVLQNNVIAAENLIDAIGPLPEEDAYRLAKAVWDAKEAYDALPEEDRSDVDSDKAATLEQAVAAMEALWETYPAGRIDREETGRWDDSAWLTPWMNGSNFDDASRAAVWDAMEDEMAYQYMHEGYDLGFLTSSPNAVQMQEGLLYVELGDGTDGGDNIPGCNPWGQGGRQWAAVVAPYAGVAFSIKSPFGYLGTGNLVLLGNAFAYEGRVYLLTRSAVYSYDADSLPASREDITVENLFPGADAQGQDMTNGVFAYAAALYNQAEKWNNDTVGIPSGSTLLTEDGDTCYQVFEGPDGGACIVGDAAAVAAADANVPTEAALVLDADDLAALLAATGTENAGAALNQTGAPLTARPSGGAWTFAKGYITEGNFVSLAAVGLVEEAISGIPTGAIADQAAYDAVKAAYDSALAAFNQLDENEQAEVSNADVLAQRGEALAVFEEQLASAREMGDRLENLPYTVETIVEDEETDWAAEIAGARAAYEALDDVEKGLIADIDYGYLVQAENLLAAARVVTAYLHKIPADYQESWDALYEDEESYLAGEEYATYIAPMAAAVENLTDVQRALLESSGYWDGVEGPLLWRPTATLPPEPEPYTIEDVMAACRVVARNNAGGEPEASELARYDLTGDGAVLIDDIMAICRLLASYNLQQPLT